MCMRFPVVSLCKVIGSASTIFLMKILCEIDHTPCIIQGRANNLRLSDTGVIFVGSKYNFYFVYSGKLWNECLFLCNASYTRLNMAEIGYFVQEHI